MRRREAIRIGDALDRFFRNSPTASRKLAEARVPELWPQVVGSVMATHTTRIEVRQGRLWVYVDSSVVRHEIFMHRVRLTETLNRILGMELITGIIVR